MLKSYPIDKPLIINAILARLRFEGDHQPFSAVPADEIRLMVSMLKAARDHVEQLDPSEYDRDCKGYGTPEKIALTQAALITAMKQDI